VLSREAVTMRVPSGLKAVKLKAISCSRRMATSRPVAESLTRAVYSAVAVPIRAPSELYAAERTSYSRPRSCIKLMSERAIQEPYSERRWRFPPWEPWLAWRELGVSRPMSFSPSPLQMTWCCPSNWSRGVAVAGCWYPFWSYWQRVGEVPVSL